MGTGTKQIKRCWQRPRIRRSSFPRELDAEHATRQIALHGGGEGRGICSYFEKADCYFTQFTDTP